jgi:hypothetical protein
VPLRGVALKSPPRDDLLPVAARELIPNLLYHFWSKIANTLPNFQSLHRLWKFGIRNRPTALKELADCSTVR